MTNLERNSHYVIDKYICLFGVKTGKAAKNGLKS